MAYSGLFTYFAIPYLCTFDPLSCEKLFSCRTPQALVLPDWEAGDRSLCRICLSQEEELLRAVVRVAWTIDTGHEGIHGGLCI
jgi:hypothetical protein